MDERESVIAATLCRGSEGIKGEIFGERLKKMKCGFA